MARVPDGGGDATIGVQRGTGSRFTQYECNTGGLTDGLQLIFNLPTCPTTGTPSPSPTPATCDANYQIGQGTGTVAAGIYDIGNHCDNCTTSITLPFAVPFYSQYYSSAIVSSNGRLGFTGMNPLGNNVCLPDLGVNNAIAAYWDDLDTSLTGCAACGIFTSDHRPLSQPRLQHRMARHPGRPAAAGQLRGPLLRGIAQLRPGLRQRARRRRGGHHRRPARHRLALHPVGLQQCRAGRRHPPQLHPARLRPRPAPPPPSRPPPARWSSRTCPPASPSTPIVRCLACRGIVGGYPCGGPGEPCPGAYFRPGNNVTRGQIAKIVANAAGFADAVPSTQQTFEDVPPGSTFWLWIERMAGRGLSSAAIPAAGPASRASRPATAPTSAPTTTSPAASSPRSSPTRPGYTETPTAPDLRGRAAGQHLLPLDRAAGQPGHHQRLSLRRRRRALPPPGNRPYFRPNNNVTRGQTAKIVANTFFPGCAPPARR